MNHPKRTHAPHSNTTHKLAHTSTHDTSSRTHPNTHALTHTQIHTRLSQVELSLTSLVPNLRFSKWLALEGSSGEVNVEVLFRPAPPAQTQQVDTPPGSSSF